jgi:hypothetical protein
MHNFTPKRSSQFTIEKQVIGGFNDSTISYTTNLGMVRVSTYGRINGFTTNLVALLGVKNLTIPLATLSVI